MIADFNRTGTLGIDIGADKGAPVMAVLDGTVHYIGNNNDGYGQFVLVRHNIRLPGKPTAPVVTVYGNLSKVLVRLNESVRAGQKIAEVGESSSGLKSCVLNCVKADNLSIRCFICKRSNRIETKRLPSPRQSVVRGDSFRN